MSIYILLQINFAIENLRKTKGLPSFTIQLRFQFSTRHFLTEVGSQGWKGAQTAVDVSPASWGREEGMWLMESLARAAPRLVLSPDRVPACLPSPQPDLKGGSDWVSGPPWPPCRLCTVQGVGRGGDISGGSRPGGSYLGTGHMLQPCPDPSPRMMPPCLWELWESGSPEL